MEGDSNTLKLGDIDELSKPSNIDIVDARVLKNHPFLLFRLTGG